MTPRQSSEELTTLRHMKAIGATMSEGVILIDPDQHIRWANEAALAAHGVTSVAQLGQTLDEYHERFQVRFCNCSPAFDDDVSENALGAETCLEVVIEVSPIGEGSAHKVFRMRNLVLTDDHGHLACSAHVLRPSENPSGAHTPLMALPSLETPPMVTARRNELRSDQAAFPLQGLVFPTSMNTDVLCDVHPLPLIVLNALLQIQSANDRFFHLLDMRREEVIGRPLTEFIDPTCMAEFAKQHWVGQNDEDNVDAFYCILRKKDGSSIQTSISARATRDHVGRRIAVCTIIDISSQERRSDDCFEKFFAVAPAPMLIRKIDAPHLLGANDAFLAASGYEADAVVGSSLDDMLVWESRVLRQEFESRLRNSSIVRHVNGRLKTVSGEVMDFVLSAARAHMFGQPCLLIIMQDVTDQRRSEAQLFQAIEKVMQDTSWFSRAVIEKLAAIRNPVSPGVRIPQIDDLTRREREVLVMISTGLSDAQIAERLGLTRSTVRNHVAALYSKIDVHSRSSAIVWARERGINLATTMGPRIVSQIHTPAPMKEIRRLNSA